MNFRYRVMQFMSGRYGVDTLFYGLMGAACAVSVLNLFLRSVWLQWVVYGLVGVAVFRVLSRNCAARRAENAKFTSLSNSFRLFAERKRRQRQDRSHVYRKCRRCKAVLRLPRRKGHHKTVCPKCGNEMRVHVFLEK